MGTFHQGEGEFLFPNQDKYAGHFCAHVSGLAWREGHGIYTTHDGQLYEGNWKDDKLNEAENVEITFQNKNHYNGRISKFKYHGPGTYTFTDASRLTSIFANNKPSGDVLYIDGRDEIWYGKAGADNVILTKEHIFSSELDNERGKGRELQSKEAISEVAAIDLKHEDSQQDVMDMKQLEKFVFAKSFKTAADIDFQQSEWVTDYQKYETTRKIVAGKLTKSDETALTDEENEWHKQYLISNRLLQNHKVKKVERIHDDTLGRYLEEEMKNTCPPEIIISPHIHCEEGALEG